MSTVSRLYPLFGLAALVLMGCSSQPAQPLEEEEKAVDVASVVRQKMPVNVKDQDAWAQDLARTFESQKLAPTAGNICSVLTVAQQESGFQVDPAAPGLSKIAWKETDCCAERIHIPLFVVHTTLKTSSPMGKNHSERLDTMKTEEQLSAISDDSINMAPMRQTLFGSLSPIHTGGPMQVSIAFTEQHTNGYSWEVVGTVRREVFSRRGGLWFGAYYLFNYPANYGVPIFRFADSNVGWYASRNVAFQNAVSKVSGVKLAMDEDLILYGDSEPDKTRLAVCKLAGKLGISESKIRQRLQRGDSLALEKTALYKEVYKPVEAKAGKTLLREMPSDIQLGSPRTMHNLTTAWFAKRVDDRRAKCMNQSPL